MIRPTWSRGVGKIIFRIIGGRARLHSGPGIFTLPGFLDASGFALPFDRRVAVPVAVGLVGWVLGRVGVFSRYRADIGLSIGNRGSYSRLC